MNNVYQKIKESTRNIPLPAVFLNMDQLLENGDYFLEKLKSKKLRVATKSIRSLEVLQEILRHFVGNISGVMSYSAREAVWLSKKEIDNIMVAYPVVNEDDIGEVCERVLLGSNISLMADSENHLERYNKVAKRRGVTLPICLDIDVSLRLPFLNFGVYRSVLKSAKDVEFLLDRLESFKHLKLVGMMTYEAQIAGVPDKDPSNIVKSLVVRFLKFLSKIKIKRVRKELDCLIEKRKIKLEFFNGGGTGSADFTASSGVVSEVTIGSGFYTPSLFEKYSKLRSKNSLFYGLEISRISEKGIYTCLGGGYQASGAIGVDKTPIPFSPKKAKLISTEMVGEVQTPVIVKKENLEIGDPIFFKHSKAGELLEHFNEIHIIRGEKVLTQFKTYRGERKKFI